MNKFLRKLTSIIGSLFIIIGIMMGMTACQTTNGGADAKPLKIVTTFFAPYDFTRSIVSDYAEISMLLKPGAEVHSFEPTPQDLIQIQKADIFIYTGGENDTWVDSILDSLETNQVRVIRMLDLVNLYEEEDVDEDTSTETHSKEEEKEWDEHVWTDPENAILITEAISKACIQLLEECGYAPQAKTVEANTKAYLSELQILDYAFFDVVENSSKKTLVVADRFPFRYFVEAYGLDYIAAFPGCSAETEASANKLAYMIDYVKEHQVAVVYTIELSNGAMAKTICEDTGSNQRIFYSCQNISLNDYNAGETYLSLMYKNVETLKEALN